MGDSTLGFRLLATTPIPIGDQKLELIENLGFVFSRSTDAVNGEMTAPLLFGSGYSAYNELVAGVALMADLGHVNPFISFDIDTPTGVSGAALAATHTTEFGAGTKRGGIGARFMLSPSAGDIDLLIEGAGGVGAVGFARTAPWMITAAYSFAFDPSIYLPPPPPPKVVAPPPPPPAATGTLRGTVSDAANGRAVKGAVILIEGLNPVATDWTGAFVVPDVKPGPLTVRVEREGYKPGAADAKVTVGTNQTIQLKIDAIPPPPPPAPPPPPPPAGYIAGQIRSGSVGVSGTIKIMGVQTTETRTAADGTFSLKLYPGRYELTILPDGYLARAASANVNADEAVAIVVQTSPRPAELGVKIDGDNLVLAKPFVLDEKRAAPLPAEVTVLGEIADYLAREPTKKLVINVHSDQPKKDKSDRTAWTEERSNAIRDALLALGLPAERVDRMGWVRCSLSCRRPRRSPRPRIVVWSSSSTPCRPRR